MNKEFFKAKLSNSVKQVEPWAEVLWSLEQYKRNKDDSIYIMH